MDVEGRPGVPTHWLFFSVPSLDVAVDRVRTHDGIVIGPIELPNGVRVAACDDAQGAAFSLVEPEEAAQLASVAARLRCGPAAEAAEAEPKLW
jgi:predicted enzyme related to lactoylglutathione lyase